MAWLGPLPDGYVILQPLRMVNSYGLFAVMTTSRPEVIVEGSDDGRHWREYGFRDQPGAPDRRPELIAPHMPRLDWQMWFAALGDWRGEAWILYLCDRLLRGSPAVLRLMGRNPFPDHPPRYVRTLLYRYSFTTAAERRRTGAWWKREFVQPYAPAVTLENDRLAPARELEKPTP